MTFLQFVFSGFFHFVGAATLLSMGCYYSFLFVNRTLRTVKVLVRGWPPPHLDADGDWKP